MAVKKWNRIPLPINEDRDRRDLVGILTAAGLEVRIVKIKPTNRGTPQRYVEYRDTGLATAQVLTKQDVIPE